ncbi:MAG TPA: CocE/NonD family hydrolase [Pyrinomonadaceae bacterium]|nr:CocE/NonD family hydrolase [Chloracidobacterium sp.]MBL0241520.1 CocE/NonD family hydrolase [Chloracidobacterium sp.]MBP9936994.1 CocE/NonD family hydrolase [Pyrinomonadaceae bacterium]HQY67992.1 CocE/NonD family hydrolase [Pyrinomonadaceae bacterium]HRA39143.1 CocE/NonD family hydrolase [Pyrinomonadaceae bacterium]
MRIQQGRSSVSKIRALVLATFALSILFAALSPVYAKRAAPVYSKTDAMVAMRDGVRLYTKIFTPDITSEKLPILLLRTPYGVGDLTSEQLNAALPELSKDGYIVVQQDIRGRFKSEGQFVMLRQPRDPKDKQAIDESTDTYDSIEWLLKNTKNNNGRVGLSGTSYGGWLTVMGMLDPHPALKAIVPQASPADMWLGDDFHHNGAFRLSYGFAYTYMMETSKEVVSPSQVIDKRDEYEWFLDLGPLSNVDPKYLKDKYPTWNDFEEHPDYDAFWKRQAFAPWLNKVTVPTLNVAGWWDQEDFYGPIKIYELLEKHDTNNQNFLVVGPWNHGGFSRGDGDKLDRIKFGSATADYFRKNVRAPFLAHYLKDKPDPKLPEALTFRTGDNEWIRHDTWAPKEASVKNLYLQADKKLSFDSPKAARAVFDEYVSDPANPVPYRPRPMEVGMGAEWRIWQVQDQRFAEYRPDVLTFKSEPLTEDVTVSGKIVANIFASTSGTDSDWIVKFIDVYPDKFESEPSMSGFQLMIAGDVFRGRYYKGWEKSNPIPANSVQKYQITYPANDHTFKKGHRIMVQIQSTWFPVIDRNPQKFVPNIFKATESDFQKATQRIYRSGKNASYIALPVISK